MYIDYILGFLCPMMASSIREYVSYERDVFCGKTPVVIKTSTYFDKNIFGNLNSIPSLPLKEIEGIPILFGEPVIEEVDGRVFIHADLVASTFFLITRYEEMVRHDVRDGHGRFIGKESLPYKAGFISRPVVDEYGALLRKCLRKVGVNVEEPNAGFSHINLTHDVDVPWIKYSLIEALKRFGGELIHQHSFISYPFLNILGHPEKDPYYTFPALIETDNSVSEAESIYFIKSGGHIHPEDAKPYIMDKGFCKLMVLLDKSEATLGYHVSYEAGINTKKISEELKVLKRVTNRDIKKSRNHYLASREPSDYEELIKNGITDDYTMAYADVAGFRLGTCRPVRWINPETGKVTDLTLHPMTIMDVTLTEKQYMGLNENECHQYGDTLIESVFRYGGEVTLLWHNNPESGNEKSLNWRNYRHFIGKINKMINNNSINYAKN